MPAREIFQGDLYWVRLPDQDRIGSDVTHPHVVLQHTALNQSRIATVVVCALSTNMKKAFEKGNVLLDVGEGNLEKRSLVVVGQVSVVEKSLLTDYIGCLGEERLASIFAGMGMQQK